MPTGFIIQQCPKISIVLSCHLSKASTKLWFLCLNLYQTLLTDNLYLYQSQHLTLTIFPHLPLLFPILHISPWSMPRDPRTHCVSVITDSAVITVDSVYADYSCYNCQWHRIVGSRRDNALLSSVFSPTSLLMMHCTVSQKKWLIELMMSNIFLHIRQFWPETWSFKTADLRDVFVTFLGTSWTVGVLYNKW